MNNIKEFFKISSERVETFLESYITNSSLFTSGLNEGMRYSLFAGGKRLRPALVYASYSLFKDDYDYVTPFAAAIEVIHTYSLIHDDLPAMDNDDMRRGKPSNHKAFEIMSDTSYSPQMPVDIRLKAIYKLARAAGDKGMVGGQFADITSEGRKPTIELVDYIHKNKTSALIECAIYLGAVAAEAKENEIDNYMENLEEILNFADVINNADVSNLDITIGAYENKNVFRKDEVKEFGNLDALLQNAPEKEQNMFRIPKVIN